jgi:major type 1 subunit fimbrin (pilin)
MKSIKLASATAIALGLAFAGSASAQSGGTITFTGSVADATCTVSGGTGSDGGVGSFVVNLTEAAPADLATAGNVANAKQFNVVIGGAGQGSCVDGTIATMGFVPSSPQIDAATGALINVADAGNVQVQLLDGGATGTAINLAAGSYSATATVGATNTAIIPFGAQYLATAAATPGLVRTAVLYTVNYN